MNPQSFAVGLLKGLGAPVTPANVRNLVGWMTAEGGHWHNSARYNPLNTTQAAPGSSTFQSSGLGSAAIRIYNSWQQGLQATLQTLKNGRYGGIISALKSNANPSQFASAVGSSPWGTSGSSLASIIGGTPTPSNLKSIAQQASGASQGSGASGMIPGSPALKSQITTGGVPNVQAALRAAVQKQLWKPINTTGKVDLSSANSFLNEIVHNVDSGQFNTPLVTKTLTAPGTPARPGQASPQLATPSNGHVNPFPGAVGSRLDQGMDMTIKKGVAPFAGKVVYSTPSDPGWKGGGYIAIAEYANGKPTGRIIYIAEGIRPTVGTGQMVRAGQLVATPVSNPYNGIVGNIEAGWAAGNGRQPLAQTVANRPQAALSFYKWLQSLGGPKASSTSNAGFP